MLATGGGGAPSGSGRSFPALGFDPAEGEVGAVQAAFLSLATTAETINATLPRLQEAAKIADTAEWGGSAAEEFSDHGDDLPLGLGRGLESVTAAAQALGTWADQMAQNQAQADQLEREAKRLKEELKAASAAVDEAAGAISTASDRGRDAAMDTYLKAAHEWSTLNNKLQKVIEDAKELKRKHLSQANEAAATIRSGPDDAFTVENDSWYVQAFDGVAKVSDGLSLGLTAIAGSLALAGAGIAATGIGLPVGAALEVGATATAAAAGITGGVGSLATLGQQLSGSRHAKGWPVTLIGLGTSAVPFGGIASAAIRNGAKLALKRGSAQAAKEGFKKSLTSGALPGGVKDLTEIRRHGLEGKTLEDLAEKGEGVAKRRGLLDDLPADPAARKEALQYLGLEARQQERFVQVVDSTATLAEKAGIELTPDQKNKLEALKVLTNPTASQLESAAEGVAKNEVEQHYGKDKD